MDLTPYLQSLRESLNTTASAGDEQLRRAAAVLSAALEPAARLALMNALADLAAEVTANLPDQVVDVRLDGRDVRVVVTGTATGESASSPPPPPPPPQSPPPPPAGDGGDISRITLRLFEQLKGQAEQAAAAQGVSLNTFVSQAVQGALQGKHQHHGQKQHGERSGSHLHGWVKG
ncbi:HicB-like protein involved in pilus formation [Prauserella shujinwangii]|uniref:HicB-like protein involved in pilus formation n=1 Tax=Prauserella shujinwangii TaxID=1453103 RepID=A0A2T0M2W8_9PSEU|nr:toxin-antitoxin system HicB family antitoxin [Prauserella shujinwangii]PRX51066.1 HicB-like protein involved in pilus formation [Prauserella shujinwangii]